MVRIQVELAVFFCLRVIHLEVEELKQTNCQSKIYQEGQHSAQEAEFGHVGNVFEELLPSHVIARREDDERQEQDEEHVLAPAQVLGFFVDVLGNDGD